MDDATFQKLCGDVLAGELPPAEAAALLAHLRDHPEQLEELGRSLAIDRLLPLATEPPEEAGHFAAEVVQRIQTAPQAEVFARSVRQRITPPKKRIPWIRVALPLAAVLVLLAVGTWFVAGPSPLARVAAVEEATWSDGTGLQPDDTLDPGQVVALESGLLSIDLPGRGSLVLEGRSALTVLGPKRFALNHGRATFTVTPGGRGLTVETPHGTVVDLGTAFALEVGADASELHVIEGEVEFSGTEDGGLYRPVLAGQSLRATATAVAEIPSRADRFVQHLPTPANDRTHVRWSCQDSSGMLASASGTATSAPLELRSAHPDGALPSWDSSQGRRGLRFDGRSSYALAKFPGVLGSTSRTVALWVKVPESWSAQDGGALVSWGRSEWQEPGLLFELALNRDASKGPLGAPQLDTYGHTATAALPINDDEWHHLAVTTSQRPDGNGATQVLFHLDGHLVDSSPRFLPRIDTVASSGGELVVGRSIQGLASPEPPAEAFFGGLISEVVITGRALTGTELRRTLQSGDPW